ncbi:MAG TPA: hypothetical protein VFJ99_06285 [Solirubrobacterales bacterium]|nr:hypothetical protein [Solirubrobacterales bacterium]
MQANSSQRSVSERENKPMQRAVLAYLLFEFPRKLKREDLERRSAFDGSVDDVIHLLHAVGLVWCEGDYVVPTLPARHFDWLELP